MTAGSAATAMWLVLAPFGFLNLSRYTLLMDPSATTQSEVGARPRRMADGALRLLGLVLTLILVTSVTFAALDLLAWQCAGTLACTKNTVGCRWMRTAIRRTDCGCCWPCWRRSP